MAAPQGSSGSRSEVAPRSEGAPRRAHRTPLRPRTVAALALAACAALAAGVAYVLADRGPHDAGTAPAPALAPEPRPDAHAPAAPRAGAGELFDLDAAGAAGAEGAQAGRALGVDVPPPDALRAVRGRVVDAQTGEPLAGMELTLLSRRPRTVHVRTDAEGRFESARELASGVVAVQHHPAVADLAYAARWDVAPGEFLLPRADVGAPAFAVELLATRPRAVLEVDVRLPDGRPAADASVALAAGRRDEHGVFRADARDFELCDAQGRARFALFGDEAYVRTYRVEAEGEGGLVSAPLDVDPPLPRGAQRLDLFPGGVVHVRVRNDEGRPVAGASLWISTPDAGRATSGKKGDTDANGECVFSGLVPACWTVSAAHARTGEAVERSLQLERGEYHEVELRLSVAGLRLAAQGTVTDEVGYPLAGVAVHVQSPGAPPIELATDFAGQFQYWSRPGPALLLGFGGGFLDDRFEPAVLTVPFGTSGIVVRRQEPRAEAGALVQVVDAETGAPCGRASVWLGHAEPNALTGPFALQRWSAPSGVAEVRFKLREDTFLAVDAPGYLRAEARLGALLEEAGAGRPLRIELARGFERRVEVRDRLTRAPVAGATLTAAGALLGVTDPAGLAVLRGEAWPAAVRVEKSGYEPLSWDPVSAGYPGAQIWIEPLRAR